MVKNLITKRINKQLTVEEFWDIKNTLKAQKKITKPISQNIEDKIDRRHRYQRQKDLVKSFNPLAILLQNKFEKDGTHVNFYYKSKSLPRTLKKLRIYFEQNESVVLLCNNLKKIYQILIENIKETEQVWEILTYILRDTLSQSFDIFLDCLHKIVSEFTMAFDKRKFKLFFDVIAVFYQTNLKKIQQDVKNLQKVWNTFLEQIFKHKNRYIRQFGLESFSYVLNKLDSNMYDYFINKLLESQIQEQTTIIGTLLFYQLKFIKNQISHLAIDNFNNLWNYFYDDSNNKELSIHKIEILKVLLKKVFDRLTINNINLDQSLFDLDDFVTIVRKKSIKWFENHHCITDIIPVISAFNHLLQSKYKGTKQIKSQICDFVKSCIKATNTNQIDLVLLVTKIIKQDTIELNDQLYQFLKTLTIQNKIIMLKQFISQGIYNKKLLKFLVISIKIQLKTFLTQYSELSAPQKIQYKNLIYKLLLIFKKSTFYEPINLTTLEVTEDMFVNFFNNQLQNFSLQNFETIYILLKLSKNLVISNTIKQTIHNAIKKINEILNQQIQHILNKNELEIKQDNYFQIDQFLPFIYLYCEQKFKSIHFILSLKEEFVEIIKIHKPDQQSLDNILGEDSTRFLQIYRNRINLIQHSKNNLSNNNHQILLSRTREIRRIYLQKIPNTQLTEILKSIDLEQIDLENQRQVKRQLLLLQKLNLNQDEAKLLIYWCIGFSFTGFKLIDATFSNFVSIFLNKYLKVVKEIQDILFKFLCYFNFRSSRVFQKQLNDHIQSKKGHIDNYYSQNSLFIQNFSEDYPIHQNSSGQVIAFDKITKSFQKSDALKQKMNNKLTKLLEVYFEQQFFRNSNQIKAMLNKSNNIIDYSQGGLNLIPPHPNHMELILRLVPNNFVPPYECLHFNNQFRQIYEKKKIKTIQWQRIWQKKQKEEKVSLDLSKKLSVNQFHLYLHYLWKFIMDSNEEKRQTIFEHLRLFDKLDIKYLLNIHVKELFLELDELRISNNTTEAQRNQNLLRKLNLLPQKKLISFIYISNSFFKTLKINILEYAQDLANLLALIMQLSELKRELVKQNINWKNKKNMLKNIVAIQNQEGNQQNSDEKLQNLFKNVKKEVTKSFNIFFEQYSIFPEIVKQPANDLLKIMYKNIAFLKENSSSSVPGILKILQKWSEIRELHFIFETQNILQNITAILENKNIKKQVFNFVNDIFLNLFGVKNQIHYNKNEKNMMDQQFVVIDHLKQSSAKILQKYIAYIQNIQNVKNQKKMGNPQLLIIKQLTKYAEQISLNCSDLMLDYLYTLLNQKKKRQKNKEKILILLDILHNLTSKNININYIKLMYLVPNLEIQEKQKIVTILRHSNLQICDQIHSIASNMNSTINKGLVIETDYNKVFDAFKLFESNLGNYSSLQKQYIILNSFMFAQSQDLALRSYFSKLIEYYLKQLGEIDTFKRLLKIVLKNLKAAIRLDIKFYSYVSLLSDFFEFIKNNVQTKGYREKTYSNLFKLINSDHESNFFKLIVSISQTKKLKALNMLKSEISNWKQDDIQVLNQEKHEYPNSITNIILPILQEIIFKKDTKGNLTSSLILVANQIYGMVFKVLKQSEIKQQLKRLISKIKFKDTHSKNNVTVIKIISEILNYLNMGQTILPTLQKEIQSEGVKILDFQRQKFQLQEQEDNIEDQQDQLDQVNRNYINLDKKLIRIEQQERNQQNNENLNSFMAFLRKHVVVPLKSMLFFQTKQKQNQQDQKGRIFLAVALTKILIKLPVPIFLIEFNKIVTKLCRMMKKKNDQIRENSRKCLTEIVKITGPSLLYIVFKEMIFHLKDNFQRHVLNYTIHYILEKNEQIITTGKIDHCLPLILPCIFNEIFGVLGNQKQMMENNQLRTPMYEAKKRKGFNLLSIISRLISINKLEYLIQYLKSELKRHLTSEANINKFESVINNMISGFYKNNQLQSYSQAIINLITKMIKESNQNIKDLELNEQLNENMIRTELKKTSKINKNDILQIQDQAAKGGSIFQKITKDIANQRNYDILHANITNFYLSFFLLCLKGSIITQKIILESSQQINQNMKEIFKFIFRCLNNRENSILIKALKITLVVLKWELQIIKKQRKKVAVTIIQNLSKLTSTDQQLIKESFLIINFIFTQSQIPTHIVNNLLIHIKLYIMEENREALELLRIIIIKSIKNKDIPDLINLVKEYMISSYREDIQKVCKSIYILYNQNYNQKEERKGEEIMYLLKNLDYKQYKGRVIVLEILDQFFKLLDNKEIEHFAEIITIGLMAAYTNEQQVHLQQKIKQIVQKILRMINKSKVKNIFNQGMCWLGQQQQGIRLNGINTLNILKNNFPNLLIEKKTQIVNILLQIIKTQYQKLDLHLEEKRQKANQQRRLRNQVEWENIINTFTENHQLTVSICLLNSLILIQFFKDYFVQNNQNVQMLYYLTLHPKKEIHQKCLSLFVSLPNSAYIKLDEASIKKNQLELIKNMVSLALNQQSSSVLLSEYIKKLNEIGYSSAISNLFICLRKGLHHRIKNITKQKESIKFILKTFKTLISYDKILMKELLNTELKETIMQITFKFLQQQEIIKNLDPQIHEMLEETTEILKQLISAGQYYKKIGQLKQKRKQTTAQAKKDRNELAITDPEKYNQMKIKKKVNKKIKKQ